MDVSIIKEKQFLPIGQLVLTLNNVRCINVTTLLAVAQIIFLKALQQITQEIEIRKEDADPRERLLEKRTIFMEKGVKDHRIHWLGLLKTMFSG